MRISQLIDILQKSSPANFIWGSGCSGLERTSVTYPADRSLWEAVKKYDHDPLLSQIKRNFYHRTAGLEDVHSCLLALNPSERKQVLTCRTNWANICMAELLRIGRAAHVLTTNFDGSLILATANFRMMPPLYRRDFPELSAAAKPSIYLLGDAPAEAFAGLLQRGAGTGPWIVIGASGKHFGLSQALLSMGRYEQGLYWVGHFHEEPPSELRDDFFTPERNAHWVSGFDAESFMAYLLRGLGEFPPPPLVAARTKPSPQAWLKAFEEMRPERVWLQPIVQEVERVQRFDRAELRTFLEKFATELELANRAGDSASGLGIMAHLLARHRAPLEVKPYLEKAALLMEEDEPSRMAGQYAEVCSNLAQFSHGERAEVWYARADAVFERAHRESGNEAVPREWPLLLAEWSGVAPEPRSAEIFERARTKFVELLAPQPDKPEAPLTGVFAKRDAEDAAKLRKFNIVEFVLALQRRARALSAEAAPPILAEARTWLEELHSNEGRHTELLARHLLREAEVVPARQDALVAEAEEKFQLLMTQFPNQTHEVLRNWASALGELAKVRSGEESLRFYAAAEAKFQEAETIQPDHPVLHNNWASTLMRQSREPGSPPDSLDRARLHALRANEIEPGQGSYNLACIAARLDDYADIAKWLGRSAEYGKIPSLSHILQDRDLAQFRHDRRFLALLDEIFDAGLVAEASHGV